MSSASSLSTANPSTPACDVRRKLRPGARRARPIASAYEDAVLREVSEPSRVFTAEAAVNAYREARMERYDSAMLVSSPFANRREAALHLASCIGLPLGLVVAIEAGPASGASGWRLILVYVATAFAGAALACQLPLAYTTYRRTRDLPGLGRTVRRSQTIVTAWRTVRPGSPEPFDEGSNPDVEIRRLRSLARSEERHVF